MEAMLIQQKCEKALKGEGALPVTMSQVEKIEMVDKARSAIVLCLGDKILREVAKKPTAASMWSKLESLYDKVFGSSAIPKATTLLIQDGGVKGHYDTKYIFFLFFLKQQLVSKIYIFSLFRHSYTVVQHIYNTHTNRVRQLRQTWNFFSSLLDPHNIDIRVTYVLRNVDQFGGHRN